MKFLYMIGGLVIAVVGSVGLMYLITNLTFKSKDNPPPNNDLPPAE